MKKFYFLLITICFIYYLALQAMEQNVTSLSSLPRDVKLVITQLVAGTKEKKIAAKNLAALGSVNREFNALYGQAMEKRLLPYKTGFSYFHNGPLSINNVKAEFEKAKQLNDVLRINECNQFINEHCIEILVPSWGFFATKGYMQDRECDTLAGQIIQDKLPKEFFDFYLIKRDLCHAIQRRQDLCLKGRISGWILFVGVFFIGFFSYLDSQMNNSIFFF